jgi:hypothetical protein
VLGHLAQRDSLSAARDQYRDVRSLNRAGGQRCPLHTEVATTEREGLSAPEPSVDTNGLLQRRLARWHRRDWQVHPAELILVVAEANAKHQPTAAEPVHIGRVARQQDWAAVIHAAHDGPEPEPLGCDCQRREARPAVRPARRMVLHPVRIEPELLGLLAEPEEIAARAPAQCAEAESHPLVALSDPGCTAWSTPRMSTIRGPPVPRGRQHTPTSQQSPMLARARHRVTPELPVATHSVPEETPTPGRGLPHPRRHAAVRKPIRSPPA